MNNKITKKNINKSLYTATLLALGVMSATLATSNAIAHDHSQEKVSKLAQAIAGDVRSAKNKARDLYRHPQQTLEFLGFKDDMTVVEITPGGGWYTEILAPALKGSGTFYGAHYPDTGEDNYYSNSRKRLVKKLASHEAFSEMKLTDFIPKKASALAPAGTADMVLTFRNLHNWGEAGVAQVFTDSYTALKAGGVLGVVEHRMPESQDSEKNKKSGYVKKSLAVKLALAAGFELQASSEVNANAKDTAQHPKGVWTLPPVLALKDQDKDKYLAIGESDRMTLKFVKPVK
jgi:predicted methyltransferase